MSVTVCRRTDIPNTWLQTFYVNSEEPVQLAGGPGVPVREFFADLPPEALGEAAIQ